MRILVVEDESHLAAALQEALTAKAHAVDVAAEGPEALAMMRTYPFDLVVLDVMLPGISGLEVCRQARNEGLAVPILMLTSRDTLQDKVAGLDAGADDYLVKPFELDELHARVRALLRRSSSKDPILAVGDLVLDPASGDVRRAGQPIKLSRKERALLEVLMRHAGRIVTHDQIIEHLWTMDEEPQPELVRAHIKGLRKAIGDQGASRIIQTVHGLGYRMVDHV